YWPNIALDQFYNALSGVTSERYSGEITAYKLKGIAVLYLHIGLGDHVYYSADEVGVMRQFLYTGGTIVFAAVSHYNTYNFGTWNGFLESLGSSMSVAALGQNPNQGAHFASYVAAHPQTTGVTDFTVGNGNHWLGGTTLIQDGSYRLLAFESFAPKMALIDVDPWSAANEVDPDTDTNVVVAVLGSSEAAGDPADLDVTRINDSTVQLGTGEALITGAPQYGDFDGDALQDAAFTFDVQAAGIVCEDTHVDLIGGTLDGEAFSGIGSLVTPDCESSECHP
ncbi:MAG: hypothetical protein KJP03_02135, partial [Gammaproteobacteria bacterium]|nr:hypothetical protein [Gammaproteobacteria bacterium]